MDYLTRWLASSTAHHRTVRSVRDLAQRLVRRRRRTQDLSAVDILNLVHQGAAAMRPLATQDLAAVWLHGSILADLVRRRLMDQHAAQDEHVLPPGEQFHNKSSLEIQHKFTVDT